MKFHIVALPFFVVLANVSKTGALCLGTCVTKGAADEVKECTFTVKLDLHAGELGYYYFEECDGVNPTLGIEKDVTYRFVQQDITNYYHPLGLAYYADGAHDDVDELEPGIAPPGSASGCADTNTCPAPMYIKGGEYLGEYSNNADIAPVLGAEDFGLDYYEPEFFLDPVTWASAGRIKFVDGAGNPLNESDSPVIPYEYDAVSEYDQSCGTVGLSEFTLPNAQCPETFICNKPEGTVGKFAGCLDSMNCAMAVGMTTNVNQGSAIALFNHQMIPHHQNAVNMCKALMSTGELDSCEDITDEDNPICVMKVLCFEIINTQNFQIQTMRGVLDTLGYDQDDDCEVPIGSPAPAPVNPPMKSKSSKGKTPKNQKISKGDTRP